LVLPFKFTSGSFEISLCALECLQLGRFGQISSAMDQLMKLSIEMLQRCEGFEGLARRIVGHDFSLCLTRFINNGGEPFFPVRLQHIDELNKVGRTDFSSISKAEPRDVLALTNRGSRIFWSAGHEVAEIEMGMAPRTRVHVDSNKSWNVINVDTAEASFFISFTKRSLMWPFARFNVTPGLQPYLERFMFMEQYTASTHQKTRRRYMHWIGLFIHWMSQCCQRLECLALCKNTTR